jgi:GNAT superfamily N-acetyltransferase
MAGAFADRVRGGVVLTSDPTRVSRDAVAQWISQEAYWALGRPREAIERSIDHSHLYGALERDGVTVACARVVTDEVTFAWICDVFVREDHRGTGIGTWMTKEIVNFWSDEGVVRFLLATRDAHEVYARVGFAPVARPERFMEIDRRTAF